MNMIASAHLYQARTVTSEAELQYLFKCTDAGGSGAIEFEEFGELMLRQRRLMRNYEEFTAYIAQKTADCDSILLPALFSDLRVISVRQPSSYQEMKTDDGVRLFARLLYEGMQE